MSKFSRTDFNDLVTAKNSIKGLLPSIAALPGKANDAAVKANSVSGRNISSLADIVSNQASDIAILAKALNDLLSGSGYSE